MSSIVCCKSRYPKNGVVQGFRQEAWVLRNFSLLCFTVLLGICKERCDCKSDLHSAGASEAQSRHEPRITHLFLRLPCATDACAVQLEMMFMAPLHANPRP